MKAAENRGSDAQRVTGSRREERSEEVCRSEAEAKRSAAFDQALYEGLIRHLD